MSEVTVAVNFNNTEGVVTDVMPTGVAEDITLRGLQQVHFESLKASLPKDDWERAQTISRINDFKTWKDIRVNPNRYVGKGSNDNQLFRKSMLVVSRDSSGQVIGGAFTANNTSAHDNPAPIWQAEAWAKMLLPPGLNVPIVGNLRAVHLREAYIHPNAQEALEVPKETVVVSAITLRSLGRLLAEYDVDQILALYRIPEDPADKDSVDLSDALTMRFTGSDSVKADGFKIGALQERVVARVGTTRIKIKDLITKK
jgi:hypothetical protein